MKLINDKKKLIKITLLSVMLLLCVPIPILQKYIGNNETNLKINKKEAIPNLSNNENYASYIHVDNNWTETAALYYWCNGEGSWSDPFAIENLIISVNASIAGLFIENSQDVYFIVRNCTISNNSTETLSAGLRLENSNNGRITNSSLCYCNIGALLIDSHNITSDLNDIFTNDQGILEQDCSDNVIYNNHISENTNTGINVIDSNDDIIYYNNFSDNEVHAIDAGTNNEWNNSSIGNFWDTYTGKDVDDDAIGDSPFIIAGTAGSQDNYPIWWDAPLLSVLSPAPFSLHGAIPLNFSVSIVEGINHSWWYLIDTDTLKHYFSTNGSIDANAWSSLANGSHIISFYVNDNKGYEDNVAIIIYKDIATPSIDIISPLNHSIYGKDTLNYNIIILESNLNSTWYILNGSVPIPVEGVSGENEGVIPQEAWDLISNGTVLISFYANDTMGNVGTNNITIFKDIIAPIITINDPISFEVFGMTPPECTVTFEDINGVNETWYQLTDGITITNIKQWTGTIDNDDWTAMANGTVTIIFYANDTLGNVAVGNISVYRDIIGPDITIYEPDPYEKFSVDPPVCDVSFYDINLINATWYELTNGTYTINSPWTGSIEISDWTAMGNGTVTLIFYANDTLGNIAMVNVSVYKDIISPSIMINSPGFYDIFGQIPPECDLTLYDINLIDQVWYELTDGITITNTRDWTGSIHENDWNAMGNGTVTVIFYANDTLGNVATSNVTIYKDIIAPTIAISSPLSHEVFGINPPACSVSFYDINGINKTWYELTDGITTPSARDWTGTIHADVWSAMSNGTLTVIFYANDTLGNLAIASTSIYKDIIAPIITIINPISNEVFGNSEPDCDVTFEDINGVDETWYQLTDGITITNIKQWTGTIDNDDWTAMANGTVTIIFYANDTLGNIASINVSVYKDIIAPSITITEPLLHEVFGHNPPICSITFYDINGISKTWYQLTDDLSTTNVRDWTGTIDVDDWAAMGNGTITLIYYANDTLGNIAMVNVSVYKDIISPSIVINSPDFYDIFGQFPPECDLTLYDINLIDQVWYELTDGITTTNTRDWTDSINEDDWTAMGNGTVTIIFYANDTLGNVATANVSIYKDIIAPIITISSPLIHNVFGVNPPACSVTFYDINGISKTWYQLSDDISTTDIREWTGIVHVDDWNVMGNGSVTIIFYANDTLGNLANDNVSIYKDVIAPSITVTEPLSHEVFGVNPPACSVTFYDINGISNIWYQLTDGPSTTIAREWTGAIYIDDWNVMGNGSVTIIFYANDTLGNLASDNIPLYKDIIAPTITILEPFPFEVFGINIPLCIAIFYDINGISNIWYHLTDGIITTTNREWTGTIYVDDWSAMSNGTVIIFFYANDTIGNVASVSISIYRDIIAPIITIVNPDSHELFGISEPECTVVFEDINSVDAQWYHLTDGITTTINREWEGIIDVNDWNAMNNGTVTIFFYANDTLGNVAMQNVIVYKDIISPDITITEPLPHEVFGMIAPTCNVAFYDINGINETWYQLTDGLSTTIAREWTGAIHVNDWNVMGNGTVTIIFYANDTLGNVATASVSVYKDIVAPIINVIKPTLHEVFGIIQPECEVTFEDINGIDAQWYELTDGMFTTSTRTWAGNVNVDDWNAMGNGTVTLVFYANDTLGNEATVNISVYKDIISPDMTVNQPTQFEIFSHNPPECDLSLYDINSIDAVWYELTDGVTTTTIRDWTGTIHVDDWNAMSNGSIMITFFANDTLGNLATAYVSVYKDIIPPTITIISPSPFEIFGAFKPECNVVFFDINGLSTILYQLSDEITTTTLREWEGMILSDDWDAMSNGTVTIIFYANDTLGNLAMANISVYKDIIAPTITIISPSSNDVFGTIKPSCVVIFEDINGISERWYQLMDGVITISIRNWIGSIYNDDWDVMSNGTVTIMFYANDTLGNVATASVSVYKDIISPIITILEPNPYEVFGTIHPECNVIFEDINGIDSLWYQLTDGVTTTTIRNWTGIIQIDDWNMMSNGTVTIIFFANDTVGNVAMTNVPVYKDIIAPSIIITEPNLHDVFGMNPPACSVTFYDINGISEIWYQLLDGVVTTNAREWIGYIYTDDWNAMSNGSIIITFFANDSLNNLKTESVSVYKDIIGPTITIIHPQLNDVWGKIVRSCDVDFYDINGVDAKWYQLTNGAIITGINEWTGFISSSVWNMMPNGTVMIILFANDTFGNLNSVNVSIYKDTISPVIIVNDPQAGELFGFTPPAIELNILEPHLESVWYQLTNGSIWTDAREWTGFIYQEDWDQLGNGTVTTLFIAYDSVNNFASTTLTLRKNIFDPIINIMDPANNALYGGNPPDITLYVSSASTDAIWYKIYDGTFSSSNFTWEGTIDLSAWKSFGNGTVYIEFFINDTLGNMGFDIVKLRKDIIAPDLIIISPEPFSLFGTTPPGIVLSYFDQNSISSVAYQLKRGSLTTPLRDWTGSILLTDWNIIGNGTVLIIFLAEDAVGNVASANVTIRKDIIGPEIYIYSPNIDGELYGHNIPLIYFITVEGSGVSEVSYQLVNDTFSSLREIWNGSIDSVLWNQFGNGTVTVYIYATDVVGNEGITSRMVRKDIVAPSIIIYSPLQNQEIGRDAPFFEVEISDGNLQSCWYSILGNDTEITFSSSFGRIDQTLWESIWDNTTLNGNITIRFYARDSMDNLNYRDLCVLKYYESEPTEPTIPSFPIEPMDLVFLACLGGVAVSIPLIITRSRIYNSGDKKQKKMLQRVIILTLVLVTLIAAALITTV